MDLKPIGFSPMISEYQNQANTLFEAWKAGDEEAIELFRTRHPRFLDEKIPWMSKNLTDGEIRNENLGLEDAQLALARWYGFKDWAALEKLLKDSAIPDSEIYAFETSVEDVINGDVEGLRRRMARLPDLPHLRSRRVTHFDPPMHRATLLHYLGANGVEGFRQKSPKNAAEVARFLLEAGAEVDALADMYGGQCTTMSMLASSTPPAEAGVQITLIHTLLDYGAAIDGVGAGRWVSPLMTALAFGFADAAEALARRGAKVDNIAAAAGLGWLAEFQSMLPTADPESRHRALVLAAQHGHADILNLLLDSGEDPNRYNPEGHHAHSTPLHQAALAGRMEVVRSLVERGARLGLKDKIFQGTPLGWAIHGGQKEVETYLRARGARLASELDT